MLQRYLFLTGVVLCAMALTGADPKPDPRLERLARLVKDDSPKVRLEALRALAKIPSAKSAELALSVLDKPMDPTLDYALWLTINDLAEPWIAAIQSGEWKPEGREKQLEFGLKAIKPEQASRVLTQLLAVHPLTRDGSGPWIELIGSAGAPKELRQLSDQVFKGGFDDTASARALKALSEAARLRKLKPSGSMAELSRLFDHSSELIRMEAIRLAGLWKESGEYLTKLINLAGDAATSESLRAIALETLRQIGGKEVVEGLTALTFSGHDPAVRRAAATALAAVDLGQAIPRIVEVARTTADESVALEFWRNVLAIKGAGQALRAALPEKSLPTGAAKAGMRAAREGGREDVELVVAFAKAGGLATDAQALTGEVIKDLAAKAAAQGDPSRGEMVYRRADLACLTCHSIGGAGGRVGPDMTSIGASAPVDYLVESLLLPNAKIKEGYHSIIIETKDGQEISGVLARETQQEIIVRNAANQEVNVAKNNIADRRNSTLSLMPASLLDPLSEQEKLDLVAFLSRLGKPGDFDASQGGVARKWRLYTFTHEAQQHGRNNDVWEKPLDDKMWSPVFSLVNGKLTRSVLEEAGKRQFWVGTLAVYAASEIQTAKAGPAKLKLDAPSSAEVWINGKKAGDVGECTVELPAGIHRVLVRLDPKNVPEYVRLQSPDATFPAR